MIIPDGALGYLPFDALLLEEPAETNFHRFKTHHYVLKDYQISYTYSAGLLAELKARKRRGIYKKVLAFAPTFDGNTKGLNALNYNEAEVESILDILGGKSFVNTQATLAKFLKKADQYQVLHLATHGKANHQKGEDSYLAFTERKDSLDNEFLYVRDLYNLHLHAEMVVLSACETAIGEYQRGEGIVSLARGFFYAGASSIITTLWSIDDAKTAQLMQLFYQHLQEGQTKDAALRQAKIDFIELHPHEEAHPYYWAAYVGVGEMQALDLGGYWRWIGLGILSVAVAILGFIWFRKVKNKP